MFLLTFTTMKMPNISFFTETDVDPELTQIFRIQRILRFAFMSIRIWTVTKFDSMLTLHCEINKVMLLLIGSRILMFAGLIKNQLSSHIFVMPLLIWTYFLYHSNETGRDNFHSI